MIKFFNWKKGKDEEWKGEEREKERERDEDKAFITVLDRIF